MECRLLLLVVVLVCRRSRTYERSDTVSQPQFVLDLPESYVGIYTVRRTDSPTLVCRPCDGQPLHPRFGDPSPQDNLNRESVLRSFLAREVVYGKPIQGSHQTGTP